MAVMAAFASNAVPWSKRVLIPFWTLQIIFTIASIVVYIEGAIDGAGLGEYSDVSGHAFVNEFPDSVYYDIYKSVPRPFNRCNCMLIVCIVQGWFSASLAPS